LLALMPAKSLPLIKIEIDSSFCDYLHLYLVPMITSNIQKTYQIEKMHKDTTPS